MATKSRIMGRDELTHQGQHTFDDDVYAGRRGVHAVGLVELGPGCHAVEEERIEQDPVLGGQSGIDGVEARLVFRPQVGRRQHAGQQNGNAAFPELADNGIEIGPRCIRVQAPERVVGAKLDDRRRRIVGQRPVEPRPAAGRGVARDAGVDHPHPQALLSQGHL